MSEQFRLSDVPIDCPNPTCRKRAKYVLVVDGKLQVDHRVVNTCPECNGQFRVHGSLVPDMILERV